MTGDAKAAPPVRAGQWIITLDRLGLTVLPALGLVLGLGYAIYGVRPLDAETFWTAGHGQMYGFVWGIDGWYVYPPPLAQVLSFVPFPLYIVGWMTLLFTGFWAATRWWSLPVFAVSALSIVLLGWEHPISNPVAQTVIGNPHVLIGACIVVGFRFSGAWAFVLLTKIAPGIGLLWFLVRREWDKLGLALGLTALVALVSFVLAPQNWLDFAGFAMSNSGGNGGMAVVPIPFWIRLLMSAGLIMWGARTDRPWTVPIAAGWAAIVLYDKSMLPIWIAALPLLQDQRDGHLAG